MKQLDGTNLTKGTAEELNTTAAPVFTISFDLVECYGFNGHKIAIYKKLIVSNYVLEFYLAVVDGRIVVERNFDSYYVLAQDSEMEARRLAECFVDKLCRRSLRISG